MATSNCSSFSMIHVSVISRTCGRLKLGKRMSTSFSSRSNSSCLDATNWSNLLNIAIAGESGVRSDRSLSIAYSCSDLNHNVGPMAPYNFCLQIFMSIIMLRDVITLYNLYRRLAWIQIEICLPCNLMH